MRGDLVQGRGAKHGRTRVAPLCERFARDRESGFRRVRRSPTRFRRDKSIAFVGPARGTGRRTHYAAQMSAAGTRTVPIYSQLVPVDVPTRKILSDHGLDDPCPSEFKLRFHQVLVQEGCRVGRTRLFRRGGGVRALRARGAGAPARNPTPTVLRHQPLHRPRQDLSVSQNRGATRSVRQDCDRAGITGTG